jgi:hypothetical protein
MTVMDWSDVDTGENCIAPKLMIDVRLKLFPLKVSVKSVAPASVSVGERLNNEGTGFRGWIWLFCGFVGGGEFPPPGPGFSTSILN